MLLPLSVACSVQEDATDRDVAYVAVPLSLSLQNSGQPSVKSVDAIVQLGQNPVFRGVSDIVLLPFGTQGEVGPDDIRLGYVDPLESITSLNEGNYSKLYPRKLMPRGAASCLFYGKAPKTSGVSKSENGSLIAHGLSSARTASDIYFTPDAILTGDLNATKAKDLTDYLNNLSKASSGGLAFADGYPAAFNLLVNEGHLMAGSSTSIQLLVQKVYDALPGNPSTEALKNLKTAIENQIKKWDVTITNKKVVFSDRLSGYPGEGIPEGSVALRWNGSSFQMNPAGAYLSNPSRFCYPPDLWYFANTRFNTSESKSYEEIQAYYNNSGYSWDSILGQYEISNGIIRPETTGAALVNPVQYGVGLLSISLKKLTNSKLKDRNNVDIPADGNKLPVEGVIVGAQHRLSYNFTPQGNTDEYFSYDTQFSHPAAISSGSDKGGPIVTAVLESPANKTVPFVLECRNNSGKVFEGATGSVLQGGLFYLVGVLDLSDLSDEQKTVGGVLLNKVLEQDRITTATVVVSSLKDAYNVVPDLRSPRLQVGLSVTFDWKMSSPVNIELK